MKTLILIPSINSYGLMLLMTLSLGSFPIARHVHIRWLKNYFSFVGSNAVVKGTIALLGLFMVSLVNFYVLNINKEMGSLLIGIVLGFMTIFIEMKIIRKMNRRRLSNKKEKSTRDEGYAVRNAVVTNKFSLSSTKSIQAKGLTYVRQSYSQYASMPDFLNYSLMAVIIVAVAEECLFRGYIIIVAELMHSEIILYFFVFLSTILFACSHMANSWTEFICKLPLSILTMIGFLLTGALLTAIATHITLNVYAYMSMKKNHFRDVTHRYLPVGVAK